MFTIDDSVKQRLSSEEMAALKDGAAQFALDVQRAKPFEPYAYFDQGLDCIRVMVRDSSVCEFRINEWLTVVYDTDPEAPPTPVGFTLKGIKSITSKHDDIIQLTHVFDALVKRAPNEEVMHWVFALKKLTTQNNIFKVALQPA
ncbi:MAG: hypothetical protein ACXVAM_19085 [Vulcanimicrobiaceae bacterium]